MDGHEVRVAYDGPAALEAVRDCVPDVVLLDVGLPGMDGFEVARRLRDSLGQQRPVLIAVTGWGEEEFQLKCTDAMFDHWLVKPVKSDALCKIIRESTAGNIPS
jgi:CheY-like chemotaxis protein